MRLRCRIFILLAFLLGAVLQSVAGFVWVAGVLSYLVAVVTILTLRDRFKTP